MIERMMEAEIAELNARRTNRDGTAEVLCTKAFHEITALRAENERLRAALEKMQRSRDRYRQAWEAEKVRSRAALEEK